MADEKKVELVLDEIKKPEQKTVEKSKNKTEKPVKEKAAKPERPAKPIKEKPAKSDEMQVLSRVEGREFIALNEEKITEKTVKAEKAKIKRQKQLTSKWSKEILKEGKIVSTKNSKPNIKEHIIELHNVEKSYTNTDVVTPVLKGIDLTLDRGDFIVILGPSGSGKTTLLNTISGLDKVSEGDVFVLGANLSLLKDSHLTRFRRDYVGFIFQQYNLLTNLTAKENAEVGENLSRQKHKDLTIEDIFETIGMKEQMNKYPHQMSGGQQQRVSIARALAKNPEILFGDEPTGALDEEMGRRVLQILVDINKKYKTTVIIVTHNPNIADIANTIIHVKNGLIDEVKHNKAPKNPSDIDWS
jgi:putative ABC transport system ATP-binding protein